MEPTSPIDIKSLLAMIEQEARTPGPKVTIYFSVPHASDFAILGKAELRADIHSVESRLQRLHTPEEQSSAILKKLRTLLESPQFWEHRSESYVIFASASFLRYYALPLPLHGNLWVSADFQMMPMIPVLSLPEHFYLLEVTLHAPRLAKIHQNFSVPVPLEAAWELEAEFGLEEPVHGRSFHTSASHGGGSHGVTEGLIPHGGGQDSDFRERDRFLKDLAREVDTLLKKAGQPLVLTGTKEIVQHFRTYLKYPHVQVTSERVLVPSGNPIDNKTNLWLLFAEQFGDGVTKSDNSEERVASFRAAGRVAENIDTILSLSRTGGVQALLVNEKILEERNDAATLERVNAALVMTLKHHGTASETKSNMSTGIAALLRPGAQVG